MFRRIGTQAGGRVGALGEATRHEESRLCERQGCGELWKFPAPPKELRPGIDRKLL